MKKTPLVRKTGIGMSQKPLKASGKPKAKAKPKRKGPSVNQLDTLFSLYVRRFGECQLWGYGGVQCSSQLQCSHIHSRQYVSVRWDPSNAICACAKHHMWQHNHPTLSTWALEDLLGKKHLEELREKFLKGEKPDRVWIYEWLKAELARAA